MRMALPFTCPSSPSNPFFKAQPCLWSSKRLGFSVTVSASKDGRNSVSFGDKLLDYIEGGPKLRKWYGAQDQIPSDEAPEDEADTTEGEVRDAVLVTDVDNMTGQLVVLSLIVQRMRARILVTDEKLATASFGSYVEPVVGRVDDSTSLMKACKGVRAIICPTKLGAFLTDRKLLRGVEHIVYLSEVASLRAAKGFSALLRGPGAAEQALREESALSKLGVRYTIIRHAALKDEPGGRLGIQISRVDDSQKSSSAQRLVLESITREDVAMLCVKALDSKLEESIVIEASNADAGVQNIETLFSTL